MGSERERERDREKHKWASIELRMRCEKRAVVARTVMLTAPPMPVPQSRPARPQTIYLHVTDNKAPFHPAVLLLVGVTAGRKHSPFNRSQAEKENRNKRNKVPLKKKKNPPKKKKKKKKKS